MTTTTTAIATAVAIAKRLASGPYGYGQDDRWGHLASGTTLGLAELAARGDGDCSSTTGSIYYLAGIIPRSTIQGTWYTGNGPPAASPRSAQSADLLPITWVRTAR